MDLRESYFKNVTDIRSAKEWLSENRLYYKQVEQELKGLKNPSEFNLWRRQNDLFYFLKYIEIQFPFFHLWQKEMGIHNQFILKMNSIGSFIFNSNSIHLYKVSKGLHNYSNKWIFQEEYQILLNWHNHKTGNYKLDLNDTIVVVPYFAWLKQNFNITEVKISPIHAKSDGIVKLDFSLTLFEMSGKRETAFLFKELPLMPLYDKNITPRYFTSRNLDLLSMSFLEISNNSDSRSKKVRYSNISNCKIKNANFPFLTLENSRLENIEIINCEMQNLEFHDCKGSKIKFSKCKLVKFVLHRSNIGLEEFSDIELRNPTIITKSFFKTSILNFLNSLIDIKFISINYFYPFFNDSFFRQIRLSFTQKGDYDNTSLFYYLERKENMRKNCYLFINCINSLYLHIKNGSKFQKYSTLINLFTSNLSDLINFVTWGFSERPHRIFLHLFFIYITNVLYLNQFELIDFTDSLQHSINILASKNIDVPFIHEQTQLLISLSNILSLLLLSLLIAGYSNKSRP